MKAIKKIKKESIKFNNKNRDNTYYKIKKQHIYIESLIDESLSEYAR